MPTLEAPVELQETPDFEVAQQSSVPRSDESRNTLEYFSSFIEDDVRTSEFLRIQRRFSQLRSSLVMYSRLSDDWNSYGAEKPSTRTVGLTFRLLKKLRDELFLPVRLIPSAEGGIATYFKAGDKVSYLEYRNSGEVVLAMYDQRGEPDIREFTENDNDESRAIALIREYITA